MCTAEEENATENLYSLGLNYEDQTFNVNVDYETYLQLVNGSK